jgi:hypothetical protein
VSIADVKIFPDQYLPKTKVVPRFRQRWLNRLAECFGFRFTKQADATNDVYFLGSLGVYIIHPDGYKRISENFNV